MIEIYLSKADISVLIRACEYGISSSTDSNEVAKFGEFIRRLMDLLNEIRDEPIDEELAKQFQLSVLGRRRNYLKMVIELIEKGVYGSKEDIPKLNDEVLKTEHAIKKLS